MNPAVLADVAPVTSPDQVTWPEVFAFFVLVILIISVMSIVVSAFLDFRKQKIAAGQVEDIRQLVSRYEQLAEKTLDAQQRTAADVAELRSRAASIEQILRTVE
jgi:uncharacterized membrane protein